MLVRTLLALALVGAPLLSACGDDASKTPGSALVRWKLGGVATCESLKLVQIEARAIRGDVVEGSATTPCPAAASSGEVEILDLPPTSYAIEVEGFNAQDVGTFLGTLKKLAVPDGGQGTNETVITLDEKKVALGVDWDLGGKCSTAGVSRVKVELYEITETDPIAEKQTSCENTYVDPDDDSEQSGMLFEDLDATDDCVLVLYGLDDKGREIMKGQSAQFDLVAGVNVRRVETLTACPGDPPVCP